MDSIVMFWVGYLPILHCDGILPPVHVVVVVVMVFVVVVIVFISVCLFCCFFAPQWQSIAVYGHRERLCQEFSQTQGRHRGRFSCFRSASRSMY